MPLSVRAQNDRMRAEFPGFKLVLDTGFMAACTKVAAYGALLRVIYIRSNDPATPEVEAAFRVNILKP